MDKRFYQVCFDIVANKTRYRAVKVLLKFGIRVQKSVFECFLTEKQYIDMKSALDGLIDRDRDSIRYYPMCKLCAKNVEISGLGVYNEDEEIIII